MNPKISAFSAAKNELKDQIISELSREENLPAKSIYNNIRRDFSSAITYQGVHKALKQLTFQGIVTETNHKYALNPKWIEDLNSFVTKVGTKKTGKAKLDFGEIKDSTAITLQFDTYLDALYALLDNIEQELHTKKDDITIVHWYHPWPIMCITKKEYEQIRRVMASGKHYALINQETALDHIIADFWRELGKETRFGVPCATQCELMVTQDKVAQIFLSPLLKRGLDEVFRESNSKQLNLAKLYSYAFGLKGNVTVIITQNKELADQIREETLKYFK